MDVNELRSRIMAKTDLASIKVSISIPGSLVTRAAASNVPLNSANLQLALALLLDMLEQSS